VKKNVLKDIKHEEIVKCNLEGGCINVNQQCIVSNKHKLYTISKQIDGNK
jgi:hypothetical protein